ncbi:MAG: hypothetical protein ABI690_24845 [Chloroflexota bacterium]
MRRNVMVIGFSIVLVYLVSLVNVAAAQTAVPTLTPCEALLAPDRPRFSGPNAPTIRIVTPADGSTLYGASFTVSVDIQNFDIATTDGRHWHLWVNGQLAGMVYQKDVTIDLQPGANQICATLGDINHADLGEPSSVMVTVFQAAVGTPTTPPSAPAGTGKAISEDISPIQIAVIAVIGLVAAVGGWWLGSRLPKTKK